MSISSKKSRFTPKKIAYWLSVGLLTVGASLILGFLSFSGMIAFLPILPLAIGAFVLSVIYEGQIYKQNIQGALTKLFKNNYLKHFLTDKFLSAHFPEDVNAPDSPEFFKDYSNVLKALAFKNPDELPAERKKRKKQLRKTLKDMNNFLMQQLFEDTAATTETNDALRTYREQLQRWLNEDNRKKTWQRLLLTRRIQSHFAKAFALVAGSFMGLSSAYLIVEAGMALPFLVAIPFTFWPIFVVPMSVIAGVAYGFLIYNTVIDMINNETILNWLKTVRSYFKDGLSVRGVVLTLTAFTLVTLAIALTICTAGTWWTIAKNSKPLFNWMGKIPVFILKYVNPGIDAIATSIFTIENISESLKFLNKLPKLIKISIQETKASWSNTKTQENWIQILNPFRVLLNLVTIPTKFILFLGHIISMALTSDQTPGIPQEVAITAAAVCEGVEDLHYFISHPHHQHQHFDNKSLLKKYSAFHGGHSHANDLPTRILRIIALPLFLLTSVWDCLASKGNQEPKKSLTFKEAFNKQWYETKEAKPSVEKKDLLTEDHKPERISNTWKKLQAITYIDRQAKKKNLVPNEKNVLENWKAAYASSTDLGKSIVNYHNDSFFNSKEHYSDELLSVNHKLYNRINSL